RVLTGSGIKNAVVINRRVRPWERLSGVDVAEQKRRSHPDAVFLEFVKRSGDPWRLDRLGPFGDRVPLRQPAVEDRDANLRIERALPWQRQLSQRKARRAEARAKDTQAGHLAQSADRCEGGDTLCKIGGRIEFDETKTAGDEPPSKRLIDA